MSENLPLPANDTTYQIQKLHTMHKEIIRRLTIGQKPKEIANALGVTTAMIRYTKESELGKVQLDTLALARDAETVDIGKQILEMTPRSLAILSELQEGKETPAAVRAKVALGILDRAGAGPTKKSIVETRGDSSFFGQADIERLKERAAAEGKVIIPRFHHIETEDANVVNDEGDDEDE